MNGTVRHVRQPVRRLQTRWVDQALRRGGDSRGVGAAPLGAVRSPLAVDRDRLAHTRAAVADGLRAELAERRRSFLAQLSAKISDATAGGDADAGCDTELEEGRWEMVVALAEISVRAIEHGEPWDGPLPAEVGIQARRAAAASMSVTSVLDRCMAGFSLVRDLFFVVLERCDMPRGDEHALRRQAAHVMDSLRQRVLRELERAHQYERTQMTRSMEQRRAEIARRLLAGATPIPDELADLGGYDLNGWHIAVIATGADAKKLVRLLTAQLGCRILPVSHSDQTMCALLGTQRKIAFEDIERIIYEQAKDMDASLALGELARGLSGMRITHREAEAAVLVARCEPRRITRYAEVEPEATALGDEALGDSLVALLRPLDQMRIGAEEARRTLREILAAHRNDSKAAKVLHTHRSTVFRRRKAIEESLGFEIWRHRSELERALRVEELRKLREGQGAGV